jgi:uncharacterized protein (TIGR02265 family)
MAIALAPDLAFVAPRTRFTIDVEGILARLPPSCTTKGMFFNRCLALARDHADEDELLRAADLEPERIIPFRDYPWHEFVRLVVVVADTLCEGKTAVGLRTIGRSLYDEFADSLIGRVTFGVLRNNADRVIGMGAKAWNIAGVPGEVVGEVLGDRHHRYHFVEYPADFAETLAIGVLESALHSCGEVARLLYARVDATHSVIDIGWG